MSDVSLTDGFRLVFADVLNDGLDELRTVGVGEEVGGLAVMRGVGWSEGGWVATIVGLAGSPLVVHCGAKFLGMQGRYYVG